MDEGRGVSDDLLSTDEEEELLIYADFDTVIEDGIFQNNTLLKIIALDSDEPFLQIGTQMYSGKWVDTVGTYLFFEPELPSAPVDPIFSEVSNKLLNYKFKTRKCLDISRVFINQRSSAENAEQLYSMRHKDSKESLKDIKKVCLFWRVTGLKKSTDVVKSIQTKLFELPDAVTPECGSSVQNIECNSDLMTSEEEHSLVALKELTIALKQ